MRKNGGLLSLAILLIVLLLGTLGLGYAHWTLALTDYGTVQTGDFEAVWIALSCAEFHTWPDPPTTFPDDFGEFAGQDVGHTLAYIDPLDPSILHFDVTDAYPSYAVDCQLHFANSGTIPWIVRGTTIIATSSNLDNCALSGNQTKTLDCDELTVIYTDGLGTQIDTDDGGAGSLTLHMEQPAEPDTTYTFEVRACVAQWNEVATAAQCFAAAP